jgi:hypothetical protein
MGSQEESEIGAALRLYRGQGPLTPELAEEARRLAEARIRAQLETTPVDEDQADSLLCQAYAAAGLPPPRHIHWLDGPLELVAALGRNDESIAVDAIFTERVSHCVWDDMLHEADEVDRLRTDIMEGVDCRVRNVVRRVDAEIQAVFGRRWTGQGLAARIWTIILSPVLERVESTVGEVLAHAVSNSFTHPDTDGPWDIDRIWAHYESEHETYRWLSLCAYHAAPRQALFEYFHCYYAPNEAHALAQLNLLVSGYWLGKTVALVVRKPTILSRDATGRLHNMTGPAVQYPDGWGLWARHGVHVPAWVVERPAEDLTRDDFFSVVNSEVRRVILERMGERFLWKIGARYVDNGSRGQLYEVDLPGERERVARYVQVRDVSTDRVYFLRVPPTIQTAEEAVAWTFGLARDEYDPRAES